MMRLSHWILFVGLILGTYISFGKKPDQIRIGICTDVHLNLMHDSELRLSTFVDAMNKAKPDFIIELGDFMTPDKKYAHFIDTWNLFQGDKYHVIGNHETDGGFSKSQVLESRGMSHPYYSFDKNGFHFIVLDGNDKKTPDAKPYYRFIGPEQIAWLKSNLSEANLPVILFSHQELLPPDGEEGGSVENYTEVQQILELHNIHHPGNRVIACFNGHSHFDYAQNSNGIWYITITSMSYHWLGDKYTRIRYNDEIDKKFPWIKMTAPFKEPLFTVVEISKKGTIRIAGKKSEWVGPTPWELGYPDRFKKYMRPEISGRHLKFE